MFYVNTFVVLFCGIFILDKRNPIHIHSFTHIELVYNLIINASVKIFCPKYALNTNEHNFLLMQTL